MPPWERSPLDINLSLPMEITKSKAPDSLLQQLSLEVINEDFKDCTTVYTDGSLNLPEGRAGAGVFIPSVDINVIIPLLPCSILYAELTAIQRALQEIASLPSASMPDSHFVILTPSKSSLQTFCSYRPTE